MADADSFEAVTLEWFDKQSRVWAASHTKKQHARIQSDLLPWLGSRKVGEISPTELLSVLRRIESRGAIDTAHRVKHIAGQVFRYAVATGRAERDPSADLRSALAPAKSKPLPAILDPQEIGGLLRAIDAGGATFVVHFALRLAPLCFVRPGELRQAEWNDFDLEHADWRTPADHMKGRREHWIPLATQAVAIMEELRTVTGRGHYVFPSLHTPQRPMSENTVNAALHRIGYSREQMTGHSFRTIASTLLNEQGWNPDAIERQLAHTDSNSVRAAYHRSEYADERRRMMQAWADYLDGLRNGGDVVPIRRSGQPTGTDVATIKLNE